MANKIRIKSSLKNIFSNLPMGSPCNVFNRRVQISGLVDTLQDKGPKLKRGRWGVVLKGCRLKQNFGMTLIVERVMGIEPTLSAWEAEVLPLNYTRLVAHLIRPKGGHYRMLVNNFNKLNIQISRLTSSLVFSTISS